MILGLFLLWGHLILDLSCSKRALGTVTNPIVLSYGPSLENLFLSFSSLPCVCVVFVSRGFWHHYSLRILPLLAQRLMSWLDTDAHTNAGCFGVSPWPGGVALVYSPCKNVAFFPASFFPPPSASMTLHFSSQQSWKDLSRKREKLI